MPRFVRIVWSAALGCVALGAAQAQDAPTSAPAHSSPQAKPAAPPTATENTARSSVTIEMESCDTQRPGRFSGLTVAQLLAGQQPKPEKLVRKGKVSISDESFDLYLPEPPYALENAGRDDGHHENTATRIVVDANGDRKFDEAENWFANLPIRIADQMYRVEAISDDGARVTLRKTEGPLQGLLLGRKAPQFSYTTEDGKTVSNDDYKGRAFLLDIWSVT